MLKGEERDNPMYENIKLSARTFKNANVCKEMLKTYQG